MATPIPPQPRQSQHRLLDSLGITVRDFRCRLHQHDQEGPEETVPVHSIVLIRRGVFRRSWRDESLVADANHLLFFNPGEPYRYAHPLAGGDDCTVLELSEALARELMERFVPSASGNQGTRFPRGHGLASRTAVRLHYELLRLIRRGVPALAIEDTLSQLIGEALQSEDPDARDHSLGTETAHRRRELAEEAKVLLNDRLESPPSLSSIAADLACSPFHLSRIFRTTVGVTMRQYLGSLRTRAVARQLSEHPADLTRLAIGMGYADHSHLTNAFRREFGVPPSSFRAAAHLK